MNYVKRILNVLTWLQGQVNSLCTWVTLRSYDLTEGCAWKLHTSLISAHPNLVPKIEDRLGSLTLSVKSSIRNPGVTMDQALTLDQHVKCLIHLHLFFPAEKHCKAQGHCVSSRDGNGHSCFYIIPS